MADGMHVALTNVNYSNWKLHVLIHIVMEIKTPGHSLESCYLCQKENID